MAKSITNRTLTGFRNVSGINTKFTEGLINTMKNEEAKFVRRVLRPGYWNKEGNKMNFDAVVGNPPYQLVNQGDGNGADPIYHMFIDASMNICGRGTFIHPARFLFNAGKTPKDWNNKMLHNEHYKVVHYWENSEDVFSNVDIKGGIAISLWDEKQMFGEIGVFTPYSELRSIMQKVLKDDFKPFSEIVYPRDLYRLSDVLYKDNPWAEERPSKGHKYDVGSNVFDVFPELFHDDEPSGEGFVRVIGRHRSGGRFYKWIKQDYLRVPDNFDTYKVFVAKANGAGTLGEALSTPVVGEPFVGHTVTFLSIG